MKNVKQRRVGSDGRGSLAPARRLIAFSTRLVLGGALAIVLAACAVLPGGERGGATLSGTVTYLPRIALPPDAVVHVRLDNVSLAGAPAVTLARKTIPTNGRQVPIPFTLHYDPDHIDSGQYYVIRAEIRDGEGNLLWTTDSLPTVLTHGAPADDIEVRVVQAAAPASALVGATWRLVRIERPDGTVMRPDAEEIETVVFGPDGRLGGQADCNHYFGSYQVEGDGGLTVSQVGSTLAACLRPSVADTFLREIGEVVSFAVAGRHLRLTTDDGTVLVFGRQQGAR